VGRAARCGARPGTEKWSRARSRRWTELSRARLSRRSGAALQGGISSGASIGRVQRVPRLSAARITRLERHHNLVAWFERVPTLPCTTERDVEQLFPLLQELGIGFVAYSPLGRRKENTMGTESRPNSDYTRTWSPSGEIEYATLADGTRLRYLKAGSGPALILLHTVRTQLDHFQLVIPKLVEAFTVFALDMPGMGWSDITPGASYAEPALRRATVEFVKTLDLDDVTLAGESIGATVSLTASTELEDRVRRIFAFNTYDYSEGVSRANRVASIYIGGARLPAIGPLLTKMENKLALGMVLRGGLVDGSKLPNHYLAELRRVGRRRGYPRVAREVYRNVDSMIAARALYGRVTAPVTLTYGDHDWSRIPEREANLSLLQGARSISLPHTGHFAALEQPARVAEILLDNTSA
jgi:pimeloyl-ACP methyl ester carboxylesterase